MSKYLFARIEKNPEKEKFASFGKVYKIHRETSLFRWTGGILLLVLIALFLPWTQNIRTKGFVTTARLEGRSQQINTIIAGKILKWYVKEGEMIKKGDTLLQLGEVKVEYFDPQLLERTGLQMAAKTKAAQQYMEKSMAVDQQQVALSMALQAKLGMLDNKILQQRLKIANDSTELLALRNELKAYVRQNEAASIMLDSGAISRVEFEKRTVNYQLSFAKVQVAQNKYEQSRQELSNLRMEKNYVTQEINDKLAKTRGDKSSALSELANVEAEIQKLKNLYANYDARNNYYFITAPQDGQITRAKKAGIGELVKEGEFVLEVVPVSGTKAVEIFVEPMDLPLIRLNQTVQFVFDGYPAIVFSGWPSQSYGTFRGKVSFIEQAAGNNGKFRVMVEEDPTYRIWPATLTLGAGAVAIALLNEVPVYYELWRNVNGFPPNFYISNEDPKTKK
ncbi:MAG: HlyD family efflux transporter periplasmic adaptor subunit [Saprospiraceae bacterium]|nr:HlyD family efflux transporter periplasmic adaptor subunit [Saprospiraceae bacterium]